MIMMDALSAIGVLIYISCSFSLIPLLVNLICGLFREYSHEVLRLRREISKGFCDLNAISPVNDFAKYARKKRELNNWQEQLDTELSKESSKEASTRLLLSCFGYGISVALMLWLIWNFHGVSILRMSVEWIWPLNYVMAKPFLSVGPEICEVSIYFLAVLMFVCVRQFSSIHYGFST